MRGNALNMRNRVTGDRYLTVGRLVLDCERECLTLDGAAVRLRPQSLRVLRILLENRDNLVTREQLLREIWGDRVVTDDSLVQCLVDIRRALSRIGSEVVLTVPGRGYLIQSDRLVAADHGTRHSNFLPALIAAGVAFLVISVTLIVLLDASETEPTTQSSDLSIAVLPFVDMTEEQDKRFLAEGLSEEILNHLATSDDLRVIARTSSFSFGTGTADIATIAGKLSVTHILEGSVREANDRLRVSVQLIDTTDESQRWARSYDRRLGDILDVQSDIAQSVASALNGTLRQSTHDRVEGNPYAHALIIQARSELRMLGGDSGAHAERLLRRALEIEPDNVTALAVLALAVRRAAHERGGDAAQSGWREARQITERALALDPNHAFAIAQRGWDELYFYKDFAAAARSAERAASIDPTNPEVIRLVTNASMVFDRPQVAMRLGQYIVARDPLCLPCQTFLAVTSRRAGDLELSEKTAREILDLNPRSSLGHELLGDALLAKGEPARALDALRRASDERAGLLFGQAVAHYQLGQIDEFARVRQRLLSLYADSHHMLIARLEAYTGNVEQAFVWLDRNRHEPLWSRGVEYHSEDFSTLHDDPRWDVHLREAGMTPQQLASIDFRPTLPY